MYKKINPDIKTKVLAIKDKVSYLFCSIDLVLFLKDKNYSFSK